MKIVEYFGLSIIEFLTILFIGRFFVKNNSKLKILNGGFLILIGFTLFSVLISIFQDSMWFIYFLFLAFLIWLIGFTFDQKMIRFRYLLLGQIFVSILITPVLGIYISNLKIPFANFIMNLGLWGIVVLIIWVFLIINAFRIINALDGLVPGIAAISAFALIFSTDKSIGVSLAFATLFALSLGMLIYNFYPAKLSIGNSGSQMLGFAISVLAIKGSALSACAISLFIPITFLLVLITTNFYAVLKNIKKSRRPLYYDMKQLKNSLLNVGFSYKEVLIVLYSINIILALIDVKFIHNSELVKIAVYVIAIAVLFSIWRFFTFVRDYKDGPKRVKRIYVVNQYYGDNSAATGKVLKDLCEALAQDGYDVVVLTSRSSSSVPKFEVLNGVHIERLCVIPEGNSLMTKIRGYAKYFFKVWFRFFKVRRKSTILALTTPPFLALIPILWKPFKEFKVVYSIQDLYPDVLDALQMMNKDSVVYKLLKRLQKFAISKSDYVVSIGNYMKKRIVSHYNIDEEKVLVIQNGALSDLKKNLNSRSKNLEPQKEPKDFIVQYSGNFGRAHEFQTVLGMLKSIKQKDIKNIKCQFIGGGYNYDKLKNAVEKNKIECAEFLPYVDRKDLASSLFKADVHLVISKKEFSGIIFPSKFYGIIAVGKPVIYICDGEDDITEYIKKYKIGFVVPNGDSDGLLEKVLLLKKSPELLKKFSNNALLLYKKIELENEPFKMYKALFNQLNMQEYSWKPISEILLNNSQKGAGI